MNIFGKLWHGVGFSVATVVALIAALKGGVGPATDAIHVIVSSAHSIAAAVTVLASLAAGLVAALGVGHAQGQATVAPTAPVK